MRDMYSSEHPGPFHALLTIFDGYLRLFEFCCP